MAFTGRRVLITGGGRGLGYEIAKQFDTVGATIIILDKEASLLNSIKSQHPKWATIQCDLLDWEGTKVALEGLEPCHHVVNNAGVNFRQDFLEITPDKIDFIFGVNYKSIVNISQIMSKKMIASKIPGTIVHISSYASYVQLPSISVYSASKAAVVNLTKHMSLELGPHKIRVNCVCPTYMITDFTKEYIEKNPERFQKILDKQNFKEFADPVDVGKLVVFLSSEEAKMINGSKVKIDGGC
jgi:L-xylulose reductase